MDLIWFHSTKKTKGRPNNKISYNLPLVTSKQNYRLILIENKQTVSQEDRVCVKNA